MTTKWDLVIHSVRLASMQANEQSYGELDANSIAIADGKIAAIGNDLHQQAGDADVIDAQQQWLLPGLIDCHTHAVYGGDRANEFEMRLQGVSYKEIAQQGGGIKSTVRATREASHQSLLSSATKRINRLLEEGVTTVEIKSGYGLDRDTELRMLSVARELGNTLPVNVTTTYLGAHAMPPDSDMTQDDYIDFVCDTMIPEVASQKLADAVDVFCENIGFTTAQCERVFTAAQKHNLPIKAHVEQLSDQKGAKLACQYQALSVDHIEYLDPADIQDLQDNNTVAVILPGAFYYLHETRKPPIDALRQHNIPMAVATDLNPGSSPVASLLTTLNMACVLFGLTPEEAIMGATRHAASALGLASKGSIEVGLDADLCLWPIAQPAELVYGINHHRPSHIWIGGQHVR